MGILWTCADLLACLMFKTGRQCPKECRQTQLDIDKSWPIQYFGIIMLRYLYGIVESVVWGMYLCLF